MNFDFTIYYYISNTGENPVKKFIDRLSKKQKVKVFRLFQTYQEYGLLSTIPHTKKIANTKLWEMRILGKDNIRIIYIIKTKKSLLLLHGFIKKSQRAPKREIKTALERYNDFKERIDKSI